MLLVATIPVVVRAAGDRPLTPAEIELATKIAAQLEGFPLSDSAVACGSEDLVRELEVQGLGDRNVVIDDEVAVPNAWDGAAFRIFLESAFECDAGWPADLARATSVPDDAEPCYAQAGSGDVAQAITQQSFEDQAHSPEIDELTLCIHPGPVSATKVSDSDRSSKIKWATGTGLGLAVPDSWQVTAGGTTSTVSKPPATVRLPANNQTFTAEITPVYSVNGTTVLGTSAEVPGLKPWAPPGQPTGSLRPGYRSLLVDLKVGAGGGTRKVEVKAPGEDWSRKAKVNLDEGGQRACVVARTSEQRDGSTQVSKTRKVCGRSQAKRIYWTQNSSCDFVPRCTSFLLHLEGFRDNQSVPILFQQNGGECGHGSECSSRAYMDGNGRTTADTWSFAPGYSVSFTAVVQGLVARVPL